MTPSVAERPAPARVQNLARSVDELTETVTRLGNGMLDSPALMNELRPLLEEIREGVRAPGADAQLLRLVQLHDGIDHDVSNVGRLPIK